MRLLAFALVCCVCLVSCEAATRCLVGGRGCSPHRAARVVAKALADVADGDTQEVIENAEAVLQQIERTEESVKTEFAGAMESVAETKTQKERAAKFAAEAQKSGLLVSAARTQSLSAKNAANTADYQLGVVESKLQGVDRGLKSFVSVKNAVETKIEAAVNETDEALKKKKATTAFTAAESAIKTIETLSTQVEKAKDAAQEVKNAADASESASHKASAVASAYFAKDHADAVERGSLNAASVALKTSQAISAAEQTVAKLPSQEREEALLKIASAKAAMTMAHEGVGKLGLLATEARGYSTEANTALEAALNAPYTDFATANKNSILAAAAKVGAEGKLADALLLAKNISDYITNATETVAPFADSKDASTGPLLLHSAFFLISVILASVLC